MTCDLRRKQVFTRPKIQHPDVIEHDGGSSVVNYEFLAVNMIFETLILLFMIKPG